MLNLFINYDCNLSCDYCFAHRLGNYHPRRISEADFERFCNWLEKSNAAFLGILGGEPTLHPLLPAMLTRLKKMGVAVALFTNALYADEELSEFLPSYTANIIVNLNDPDDYTQAQVERRLANLSALAGHQARLSFSRNFSPGNLRYDYLLDYCDTFGVQSIRYDVSRPDVSGKNQFFGLEESRELANTLLAFVRDCEYRNLLTGLDCCLPACMFTAEDYAWLKEHSMRFMAVCQPSLDIHTDLQASYCLPLHDLSCSDICERAGEWELLQYFANLARPLRVEAPQNCLGCDKFGAICQGGCLALRARS